MPILALSSIPALEQSHIWNQTILIFPDIIHPQLLTFQILNAHGHNCGRVW